MEYIQHGVFWSEGFFTEQSNIFLTDGENIWKTPAVYPGQEKNMHYFPIALPFVLILFFLFVVLLVMIEIGILGYAYQRLGIKQRYVFALLLLSLFGSYINIPVYQLPAETLHPGGQVTIFGMRHIIPFVTQWSGTMIAVNLGGAVIPTVLSIYLLVKNRLFCQGLLGIAIVALIVHHIAHPVHGVGIAEPIFMTGILAVLLAAVLSGRSQTA